MGTDWREGAYLRKCGSYKCFYSNLEIPHLISEFKAQNVFVSLIIGIARTFPKPNNFLSLRKKVLEITRSEISM